MVQVITSPNLRESSAPWDKLILPQDDSLQWFSEEMSQKIFLMESFLYIVDKKAEKIRLNLNFSQRVLAANWSPQMILVKSRQHGISTFILGLFFIEALTIPGLVVAVISHEKFATERLLDKIDIFHKNLPDDLKLPMSTDSNNQKSFSNGSTIYIGTAGQRAFGRGDTIHRALVSEEAHYENAERILGGLKEAVPTQFGGVIVRESTPLGDSGYYYDSVQNVMEENSDFKLIPLYWWYDKSYRIERDSPIVLERDRGELIYTEEEAKLILRHGLDEAQIRWRRWKIRSLKGEKKDDIFPQEYIENLETCFIGEASMVMDKIKTQLNDMGMGCREPLRTEGILDIWKEPDPNGRYVIWIDPAGGEGSATENDPHDGVIGRISPGGIEHVASIRSHMEQKPFAKRVKEIGLAYNKAMVAVERNGVGRGVLNYLVTDPDCMYPNLLPEYGPDGLPNGKWGITTTHESKAVMVSDWIQSVINGRFLTYDKQVIRQARALYYKDGKVMSKIHDDRIMAAMGMVMISGQARYSSGYSVTIGDYVHF